MIYDGVKTVTTAGTAEALTDERTMGFMVTVQALHTNNNPLYVGGPTIDSTRGIRLLSGDSHTYPAAESNVYDLQHLFIDVDTDGEGARFTYARR